MQNILELYLDLNQIDISSDEEIFNKIAKLLESDLSLSLLSYSKFGYIFESYKDFFSGKIDQEQFMMTGDIISNRAIHKNILPIEGVFELINYYNQKSTKLDNKIILINKLSYDYFNQNFSKEYQDLLKDLKERNTSLFVLTD